MPILCHKPLKENAVRIDILSDRLRSASYAPEWMKERLDRILLWLAGFGKKLTFDGRALE
jgi:hypothetical protein